MMGNQRKPEETMVGKTSPGSSASSPGNDRLPPEMIRSLYGRHRQGALVRCCAAFFMWIFAVIGFWIGDSRANHFWGISGAVAFLVLMNLPTLFILKKVSTPLGLKFISLLINFLEIAGYTAVMYFLGGIEATYLTLIYE